MRRVYEIISAGCSVLGTISIGSPNSASNLAIERNVKLCSPPNHLLIKFQKNFSSFVTFPRPAP